MKAVILNGPGDFAPGHMEIPALEPGDLLLQMKRAAICGTDIRILEGKKTKGVRYPSVIGHEMCGLVHKVGEGVTGLQVGDKIAVANVIPCHSCFSCLNGRENACLNRRAIGYEYDGAFAEYVRIPKIALDSGNVVRLPESLDYVEGALIEPLACCIRGLKNTGTGFGDSVLIMGAGPIGLMHLQLSKIAGARRVIVSEPIAARRAKAAELGADIVAAPSSFEDLEEIVMRETDGLGMDVVILAIGVPAIVNSALKLCRRGGTVNLFAGFAGTGECTVEANAIHYGEINVNGSTAYTRKDYHEAAELVISKKLDLSRLATHTFKIDEFRQAYEACKSGEGLKVLIEP